VPAGGEASFDITIDARNVPLGQTRHAEIELRNGTRILHTIAERHGAQRCRLQWSERDLDVEMELLGKLLRDCIRTSLPGTEGETQEAVAEATRVVTAMLDEATRISRSAYRSLGATSL